MRSVKVGVSEALICSPAPVAYQEQLLQPEILLGTIAPVALKLVGGRAKRPPTASFTEV